MKPVWSYELEGKRCNIFYDEDAENPRKEFQNYGHFYAWTKSGKYGDKHGIDADYFAGWDELKQYLIEEFKPVIILPVYMYEHSGVAFSTGSFGDPWDSGQIGFIWCNEDDIKSGGLDVNEESLKIVEKCLVSELAVYEAWVNGSCYGYELIDVHTGQEIDSCWGYYGYNFKENGLLDAAFGKNAANAKEVECS